MTKSTTMIAALQLLLAAGLAACATTSETTTTTAKSSDGTEVATVEEKPALVCKQEAQMGTRFAKKTCYTQEQWETIAEAEREARQEATANERPVGAANYAGQ